MMQQQQQDMMFMQEGEDEEQRQAEAPPSTFIRIEELESHGISKQDILKLKNGGYHTVESVRYYFASPSLCYSFVRWHTQL
jgi:hypothetical protein